MIGRLRGIVIATQPPEIVLELNNGLAYDIQVPLSTFAQLPREHTEIILHTHLSVREDAMTLYGFLTLRERSLFRHLLKVNGVGPKLALAILSSMDVDAFIHCINEHDPVALTRLPGVGKKTAERLMIEMRDRLSDWQPSSHATSSAQSPAQQRRMVSKEAINALLALGYKLPEATRLIGAVDDEATDSVETLIRLALAQTVA